MDDNHNAENSQLFEQKLADKNYYKLPNGLLILHENNYETDYLYKEIFEDQVYLKHGITINNGDYIFDVGANIGLFTLFVQKICKDANIYAFEPSPDVCESLRVNASLYGSNVKVYECGLSNENKKAVFSFYPGYSILSGFYANLEQDEVTLRSGICNQLRRTNPKQGALAADKYIDLLVKGKLKKKIYTCQLRTISSIIRENNIKQIDLLKVDVEKSELDILNGINERDWKKIKQIVVEVHEIQGISLSQIRSLLNARDFKLKIEQEEQFKNSGIFNVYAIRGGRMKYTQNIFQPQK